MERDGLVLAADLGGSALKLGLVDGSGGLVATAARPLPESRPAADRVEQEARLWWDLFAELAAEVLVGRAERVCGLVVTGATRSDLLVDAAGRPLHGAIMFRDRRARAEAEELAADTALAAALPIDASHPLARLLWLARHAAPLLGRARWLLEPKDFLALRLSGVAARDPLAAARLEAPGVAEVARRHRLPLGLLPEIRPLGARLGRLLPEVASALGLAPGLPVVAAPMDAWCATLAIGAVAYGRAYASAGSSEVVGLIVDRPVPAPGLLAPVWGEGLWHLGGPSLAGGAGLDWLARLLERPLETLLAELGEALPGETAPLALPWLAGERVPFSAPELRARLLDLADVHGPADLVRAWLEALAFWDRLVLDRAEAAAGLRATELRLTGGLAAAPLVARLKAAVLARPVLVFAPREGALSGAAGLAWTSLGRYPDLAAVQAVLAASAGRVEADANERALADRRFARWRAELARCIGEGEW